MQFGINLLPKKEISPESETFRRFKKILGSFLVIYIIFIGALVGFSLFLSSSGKKLLREKQQVEAKIATLRKKESLEVALKERAGEINKILQQRMGPNQTISLVQNLVIPGVVLNEVDITGGKIVFSGEAQNVVVLADFLDQFKSSRKEFSWLTLVLLARTSKGVYNFSFEGQPVF